LAPAFRRRSRNDEEAGVFALPGSSIAAPINKHKHASGTSIARVQILDRLRGPSTCCFSPSVDDPIVFRDLVVDHAQNAASPACRERRDQRGVARVSAPKTMIRIAITVAAFEAINATLPLGTVAFEAKTSVKGELGT
jgi:hypothetical protein